MLIQKGYLAMHYKFLKTVSYDLAIEYDNTIKQMQKWSKMKNMQIVFKWTVRYFSEEKVYVYVYVICLYVQIHMDIYMYIHSFKEEKEM